VKEVVVDGFAADSKDGANLPLSAETREQILEPFLQAATEMLREWAGTEVIVRAAYRRSRPAAFGDLAAVIRLLSATGERLVLNFPAAAASALAGRILSRPAAEIEEDLVRDCLGELANVVAGHAKVILAATPYRFTLATPTVVPTAELGADEGVWLIGTFDGDLGEFLLQVYLGALNGPRS
jgi:chemotaxis protein CheX